MSDIRVSPAREDEGESTALPALKFSAADVGDDLVQYLTDYGRYTVPREYPMARSCELSGLAVNLLRFVVPAGGSITVAVLKNGVAVDDLTVTYGTRQTGVLHTRGRARFSTGDTFDLQITTSGLGSDVEMSATIGVRPR